MEWRKAVQLQWSYSRQQAVAACRTCCTALQLITSPLTPTPLSPCPSTPILRPQKQPTALMDEVHVCVLRALCVDETPKERAEHALDMSLLDAATWPPYVWEFLRLTEDELAAEEWAHRVPPKPAQPEDAKKGGKKGAASAAKAAAAKAADASADGQEQKQQHGLPPRPKSFMPLSPEEQAAMDAVLASAELAPAGAPQLPPASEAFVAAAPRPPPPPPEYYGLPIVLKAGILARLCDHLLDCITIRAEIDRRETAGQLVAGKGGVGGAFPIMTEEERNAAEAKVSSGVGGGVAGWVCLVGVPGCGGKLLVGWLALLTGPG